MQSKRLIIRLIATPESNNLASQAVMHKIGMSIFQNPLPDPSWLQVVAVFTHINKPVQPLRILS